MAYHRLLARSNAACRAYGRSAKLTRASMLGRTKRSGSALILTVFSLFVLFSFLAFAIDTGYLAGARAEMRRSSDAASMAGCWEMYQQMQSGSSASGAKTAARLIAAQYALANRVTNSDIVIDSGAQSQEVQIGYLDRLSGTSSISQNSDLPFLAVQVSMFKTANRNGQVPFFFGKIFGRPGQDMTTSALAVMAQRVSGFSLPADGTTTLPILPFSIDLESWEAVQAGVGSDSYHYDAASREVVSGADGKPEINFYPKGTGAPGNRGTVDIGSASNSTADISRQIVHGVSRADLTAFGKPLQLSSEGTLSVNGDTGISAGVKDELQSIIGQTRVVPVFSTVSGNGNNAVYTVVKWVGIRILAVDLTGSPANKKVIAEPATIVSRFVTVSDTIGSSDGVFSPVLLTR